MTTTYMTGQGFSTDFDVQRAQPAMPWLPDFPLFDLAELGCLDAPDLMAAGSHVRFNRYFETGCPSVCSRRWQR